MRGNAGVAAVRSTLAASHKWGLMQWGSTAGISHGHWEDTIPLCGSGELIMNLSLGPFVAMRSKVTGKMGKGEAISGHTAYRAVWNLLWL